jgi:hypothetical protein
VIRKRTPPPPQEPQENWIALSKAFQRVAAAKDSSAAALLLEKIENGAIRARAHHVRRGRGLGTMVQGSPNEPLLVTDWQFAEIKWEDGYFIRRHGFKNRRLDNIVEAFGIELHLGDLDRELPAEGAEAPARPESATKSRRGRVAKFDWDTVYGEIFRRTYHQGIPRDDRAFAKKIRIWCFDNFNDKEIPETETLRKKIGIVLKGVRSGR